MKALMKFKWIFLALLLVVGLFFLFQFIFADKNEVDYVTAEVKKGSFEKRIRATGRLQAYKQVEVGAQLSGQISELKVAIGDVVKKGDLIARIDPRTQLNTIKITEAQLANEQENLFSKEAVLLQAQQELARQKMMYEGGATSLESYQQAQLAYKTTQSAVAQARAKIKISQITAETEKLNLEYSTIFAPIDGVVVSLPVEEGQTINSRQQTPIIVTIAQLDKMIIKAEISEADIGEVKKGMPVSFSLLGKNKQQFNTVLSSIDPAPQTVSDGRSMSSSDGAIYYYGRMEIDNAAETLRINMTANISIIVGRVDNKIVVPSSAIFFTDKKAQITVLDSKGKAEIRDIEIGLSDGVNTEIKQGLQEGETIVISQVTAAEKNKILQESIKEVKGGG